MKNKEKNQLNLNQDPNLLKKIVKKLKPNKVGKELTYFHVTIGQIITHAYCMQVVFHSSMARL